MKQLASTIVRKFAAALSLLLLLTPVQSLAAPAFSPSGGYIQGRVFRDVNQDYIFNDAEKTAPGDPNRLNGWTVRLYRDDAGSPTLLDSTITGSSTTLLGAPVGAVGKGQFRFVNLPDATYIVCNETRPTWMQTRPDPSPPNAVGASVTDPLNSSEYCWQVVINAGNQAETGRQFGVIEKSEIRVHKVYDVNEDGLPGWSGPEAHQPGWTIRLYQNTGAGWIYKDSVVTTGLVYSLSAKFIVDPGDYILCEVQQLGYAQSFARTIEGWVSWPDYSVANTSGATDEGEKCIPLTAVSADITSYVFGNIPLDITPPAVPTHISPANGITSTIAAIGSIDWSDVSDPSVPITYYYEASTSSTTNPDGSFATPYPGSQLTLATSGISTLGPAPDGAYYWHVRAEDAEGNSSAWSTPWSAMLDTVAPTTTVTSQTTTDTSPALSGTVSETSASVSVNVNGTNYPASVDGSGNWTLSTGTIAPALAVGTYEVVATATDLAGNTGSDSTSNELTIEAVPVVPETGPGTTPPPAAGPTNTGTPAAIVLNNNTQNNNQGNIPQVLAANTEEEDPTPTRTNKTDTSDNNSSSSGEVKAATDEKSNGLGSWLKDNWWWLLLILFGLFILLFLLYRRADDDDEEEKKKKF